MENGHIIRSMERIIPENSAVRSRNNTTTIASGKEVFVSDKKITYFFEYKCLNLVQKIVADLVLKRTADLT